MVKQLKQLTHWLCGGNSQNQSDALWVVCHQEVGQNPVDFEFNTVEFNIATDSKWKKFQADVNELSSIENIFHSQLVKTHQSPDFTHDSQNLKLAEVLAVVKSIEALFNVSYLEEG